MNWDDYRFFDQVVQAGGIRAAARALGFDRTTVSRRIARLEESLATKLFVRQATGVALTPAGEELREAASRVRQEVQSVERRLAGRDGELSGRLCVSTHPVLGVGFLMPGLATFHGLHPKIDIDLDLSPQTVNLSRNEAEIAVRVVKTPPDEAIARRVAGLGYAVYAAKSYLATHDPVESPHRSEWIGWSATQHYPSTLKDTCFPNVPTRGSFDQICAQLEAAGVGMGLAALPCVLADPDPRLSRLSEPTLVSSVFVLRHPDHRSTARVRAFFEFISQYIQVRANLLEGQSPDLAGLG